MLPLFVTIHNCVWWYSLVSLFCVNPRCIDIGVGVMEETNGNRYGHTEWRVGSCHPCGLKFAVAKTSLASHCTIFRNEFKLLQLLGMPVGTSTDYIPKRIKTNGAAKYFHCVEILLLIWLHLLLTNIYALYSMFATKHDSVWWCLVSLSISIEAVDMTQASDDNAATFIGKAFVIEMSQRVTGGAHGTLDRLGRMAIIRVGHDSATNSN